MTTVTITLQDNTRALIEGEYNVKQLDLHFSVVTNAMAFRSPAMRKWGYDGRKHYFSTKTNTLPMGLWRDARKWLKGKGHKVRVLDKRTGALDSSKWVVPTTLGGDIELRDYQVSTVEAALRHGRGILHAATGAGKTELMAAIIKAMGSPITLVLTSKATLVQQTRERLAWRLGLDPYDIGVITQGKWEEGSSGIYVALVTTLGQPKWAKLRRQLNSDCKLLLIDEGHHAGSNTWFTAAQRCKAYYRFGLTGTPKGRSDGKDMALRAVTGKIIAKVSAHSLIERQLLAKPYIFFTPIEQPQLDFVSAYDEVYRLGIVQNEERNDIIVRYANQLAAAGRKTWIFVKHIEHGKALQTRIPFSQFLAAQHCSVSTQRGAVHQFVNGKLDVLILTNIFDEGVDTPAVDALIMAAGGKSLIETLQRVGRGMRPKEDNRLFVFDFYDSGHDYLVRHSEQRSHTCQSVKYTVTRWSKPRKQLKKVVL